MHPSTTLETTMTVFLIAILAITMPLVYTYDEKYDHIDVDKIIADDTLFSAYINCMLDKGPCDVENSEDFKKLLPEVIQTSCAKCTDIQKKHVRKTVKALSEKRPNEFLEFKTKYDPEGKYETEFTAFVLASD